MTVVCNDGSCSYGKEGDKFLCLIRTREVKGLEGMSKNPGEIQGSLSEWQSKRRIELDWQWGREEYLLLAVVKG